MLALALTTPALAQFGSTTVIKDAHILTGDGRKISQASITIAGGKIASIGDGPSGPAALMAKKVNAAGKYVTPGLIDVWSTLGVRVNGSAGRAMGRAVDNFDRFADDEIRSALRQGVTTIYIPARTPQGDGGIGAVVRLVPGGDDETVVLNDRAALATTLGLVGNTLDRVRAAEQLRKEWQDAKDYRDALDTYDDDLEEYEKELKKYVEKWEKEHAEKDGEKGDDEKKGDQGEKGDSPKDNTAAAPPPRRGRRPGGRPEGQHESPANGKGDEKKDKKDDAPKKPTKPERDLDKEVLLDVIDGKLRWRVEAYRPAEILNALAIAEEYNLALVIEGATGAAEVADKLAEQDVPVILDAESPATMYVGGIDRDRSNDAVARLVDAGVRVYIGTGPSAAMTGSLALRAAQAAGHGLDADRAFTAITSDAADLLGVSEDIGRVSRGMSADLVVWSDHPFAPGAHVERVFIAGNEVYNRDKDPYLKEDK